MKHDVPASIVVFFVAVPLCLGIALASGAPLFSGIIAGIVGGLVVGAVSNSSLGVSGPAAGLTVIILASIEKLGTFEAFLLAVVLAGVFQIILGMLKAGIIGYYFPSTVIKGMLTAIGVIIILKQIPHAFGYDADYEGDLSFFQADQENTFTELVKMLDAITPGAIVVCMIALVVLFVWDTYLKKVHPVFKLVQGPLVAVVAGIVYQLVTTKYFPHFSLSGNHLVTVPVAGSAGEFVNQFTAPDFSFIFNKEVWIIGLTIAVVASLETLLSVEATDKLDPQKRTTDTNRELIAQGSGNIVSGLIGGLPVTQVILRSSANVQSGGKTKLSAIIHGLLLLICVMLVPHILNLVPLAALAAVLFVVGFKLVNPSGVRTIYNQGWSQFIPFITTVLGVVFTDLLKGIGLGVAAAIIIMLRNSYKNSHFLHRETDNGQKRVRMTLAEEVFFLNKGAIINELKRIPNGAELVIDMSKSVHIDRDVMEIIEDFKQQAASKDIDIRLISKREAKTNVPEPVLYE
ncbi:MAG: SulP family inorganic anion transporter [Bacteroidia bacterium]|nr:SulP family inorganic anion transporter [Bacteroidia bacterium]